VDNRLSTYTFRNGTKFTAPWLFMDNTALTGLTLPSTLIQLGYQTFYECTNLKSISIPSGVTEIGNGTFYNCTSLTSVTFESGSNLKDLDGSTFYGCSSLQHLEFPDTLEILWNGEFINCSLLVDITFHSVVPPELHDNTIISANQTLTIYVPAESVDAYKTANRWSVAANRIQAIP